MSLGTNSNDYIKSLIDNSSDAMQNLYYVEFSGSMIKDYAEHLKIRLKDFKLPVFTQNKNEVSYMAVSMNMPGSQISGDKTLDLTFRLDSNYKLYEFLLKQQSLTMVANKGWVTTRVPNSTQTDGGLTINLWVFDRELGNDPDNDECYKKLASFKYCWLEQIDGLSYTYDNDNPLTIHTVVRFMDFEDPMNTLTKSGRD